MNFNLNRLSAIFLLAFLSSQAFGSTRTRSIDDFKVTDPKNIFIVERGANIFTCARYNMTAKFGLGYQNKKNGFFTSVKTSLDKKNKALLKAKNKKQITTIKKQISDEKKFQKLGKPICLAGPPLGQTPTPSPETSEPSSTPIPSSTISHPNVPTATPIASSTRTPRPTSTPTPVPTTCFNGNFTKPGCFGLPSGAVGNKSAGTQYFNANCMGCHGDKKDFDYPDFLQIFVRVGAMTTFKPSGQQDLYDLVAYLNRFAP